jgi:hypothetical protein
MGTPEGLCMRCLTTPCAEHASLPNGIKAEETPDQQRIAEIRQREQAATKGPWYVRRCQWAGEDEACAVQATPPAPKDWSYTGIFYDASYDECHHVVNRDDADFIAHARADIPWLLARLATLEQALAAQQGWRPIATALKGESVIGYTLKLPERWVRVGLGAVCSDGEWLWHQDVPWAPATHWRPLDPPLAPSASADGEQP